MCEKEQCIVNSLHKDATEEDANKILKWFMEHEVTSNKNNKKQQQNLKPKTIQRKR